MGSSDGEALAAGCRLGTRVAAPDATGPAVPVVPAVGSGLFESGTISVALSRLTPAANARGTARRHHRESPVRLRAVDHHDCAAPRPPISDWRAPRTYEGRGGVFPRNPPAQAPATPRCGSGRPSPRTHGQFECRPLSARRTIQCIEPPLAKGALRKPLSGSPSPALGQNDLVPVRTGSRSEGSRRILGAVNREIDPGRLNALAGPEAVGGGDLRVVAARG